MFNKALSLVLKNKKISIVTAGLTGGVITITLLASLLPFFELQNLESLLVKETSKIESHMLHKASQSIMKKLLKPKTNTSGTGPEEGQLASEIDSFNWEDPQVTEDLSSQGFKVVTDQNGNFKGLVDSSTGKPVTPNDIANDPTIEAKLNQALPAEQVDLIKNIEPVLAEENGLDFNGLDIPDGSTSEETNKIIADEVENGSPPTEFTPAETGQQNETSSQSGAANQGNAAGDAIAATDNALSQGLSENAAIAAGEAGFKPGNSLLVTGLLSTACSVLKVAKSGAATRIITIVNDLMRHYSLITSLADQIKLNKASGNTVKSFMNILHTKNGNNMTYENSAGFKTISNSPFNSNTVKILPTSLPVANSGTQLVNTISGVAGVGLTCTVLNSPFSGIIQTVAGVVQLATDIGSFGTAQALFTGASIAFSALVQHVIIPDILRYFTPLGISGIENGPQWVNNAFLGGVVTNNRIAQSYGGLPMTSSTASQVVAEANVNQTKQNNSLSITARLFSLHNPFSLVSRMIFYLPTSSSSLISDVSGYFTGFFNNIFSNLSDILMSPKILAASTSQAPGQAYGITSYGLTDAQISKYDPIQNEQYLYGVDTVNSSVGKLSLPRIKLTGNPYDYLGGKLDNSTTDLYHCFNQSLTATSLSSSSVPVNFTSSSNDPICGSEGSLDYTNDPPQPMQESNVLYAYCQTFRATYPSASIPSCQNQLSSQYHDDIGHFTQYIIDSTVMSSYYSMMSTQ